MHRRHFLGWGASLTALPWLGAARAGAEIHRELVAQPGEARIADGSALPTRIWGYDGRVPGPTLRVPQGEWLSVRLLNRLPTATSIHWHGVRIDNTMDGVSGLTQDAVAPDASFHYRFQVPDAGTFWYHAHTRSWEQVARGLYGVLIVEEPQPIPVDRDLLLLVDDWRLDEEAQIHAASFESLHDRAHGGRLGQWVTVNGKPFERYAVGARDRLRLRVVNAANARIFSLDFGALQPLLIALDGQPTAPKALDGPLKLAPAQRADLLIDAPDTVGASVPFSVVTREGLLEVAQLVTETPGARPQGGQPFEGLPGNPLPRRLDLAAAQRVGLLMEGGAMGGMRSAILRQERRSIQELVREGAIWALNQTVGMSDDPLLRVPRQRTVVIDIRNDNRWPHGMHLHGHHFRVVERDGVAVDDSPWRDTELIEPGAVVSIAFVADNPGKWLLHCHMLEHAASGMMTWFEVS